MSLMLLLLLMMMIVMMTGGSSIRLRLAGTGSVELSTGCRRV